jgi:hypothetical protein
MTETSTFDRLFEPQHWASLGKSSTHWLRRRLICADGHRGEGHA